MKKIILSLSIVLVLACGEKKSEQKTVAVSGEEVHTELDYSGATRDAQFKNENVAQVYDAYNALKVALVKTDAATAQKAAEAVVSAVLSVENNESLSGAAAAISASEDINEQRAQFEKLTAEVKTLVENNISEGTLYYQYCPMAFDGKGAYWISNEKKVFNPYFGDVMLNCGTVDSEIN